MDQVEIFFLAEDSLINSMLKLNTVWVCNLGIKGAYCSLVLRMTRLALLTDLAAQMYVYAFVVN